MVTSSARFVGGWGFNPSGASQPPKFSSPPPQKIVKNSQNYIVKVISSEAMLLTALTETHVAAIVSIADPLLVLPQIE